MNIFVGCSSRDTDNKLYNTIAEEIGNFIVEGKHNFVFGGCIDGLMGKIYKIVSKSSDSEIIVAMAKAYEEELKKLSYKKAYTFDTVNERKNCLIDLADVIIFIPGGIGTIDEILTGIETKRAHEHNNPIIIINTNNYFGNLFNMLDLIYEEGFADSKNRELYFISNTFAEVKDYLSNIH